MVDCLLVYYSPCRSHHPNILARAQVVPGDDGAVRHWFWSRILLLASPHVPR